MYPYYPVGILEIGFNSVKMLVGAREDEKKINILLHKRFITRLGEGMEKELNPTAMKRTLDAIEELLALALERGAQKITVFATESLRSPKNARLFMDKLKERTGLEIRILSGEEEAQYNRKGIMWDLPESVICQSVLVDIGGGSTEIADNIRERSIPTGAVRISEKFLKTHPPTEEEIKKAEEFVEKEFNKYIDFIPHNKKKIWVGVGGTITTTAFLIKNISRYEPSLIHALPISYTEIANLFNELKSLPLNKRKERMKIDPQRADVILGGMIILKTLFNRYPVEKFVISVYNIIYGLLAEELG